MDKIKTWGEAGSAIQALAFLLSPGVAVLLAEALGLHVRSPALASIVLPQMFLAGLVAEAPAIRGLATNHSERGLWSRFLASVALIATASVVNTALFISALQLSEWLWELGLLAFTGVVTMISGSIVLMLVYRRITKLTRIGRFGTAGVLLLASILFIESLFLSPIGLLLGLAAGILKASAYRKLKS